MPDLQFTRRVDDCRGAGGHHSGLLHHGCFRDLRNHSWRHRSASGVAHDTVGNQWMEATVMKSSDSGSSLAETMVATALLLVVVGGLGSMGVVGMMTTENQGHLAA